MRVSDERGRGAGAGDGDHGGALRGGAVRGRAGRDQGERVSGTDEAVGVLGTARESREHEEASRAREHRAVPGPGASF